ncbi:MAG: HAMP domain-containing protein, partial [Anaerolineae bacterium]|nr:HAMP domain-containing protein [Anaerolineae bacterium]
IIDTQNTVLMRYPDADQWLGKTYLNSVVLEEISRSKEGSTEGINSNRQERLYGFTAMNTDFLEAYIIVGTLKKVAYADVTATTQRSLFALTLVSVMIVIMTWVGSNRLTRPVTHLVEAAERLTEGDLKTRVMVEGRIRELVQLASYFNRMADSIEKRVSDRTAQLREANETLQQEIETRQRVEQELQKNAEYLKASNQALESFAYTASHDLQEPLRKIQTFSSRLLDKYGDTLGEDDYLRRIQSASSRMQQLIQDLLMYSQVSSENKPFQPINLNRIIEEIQSDLETQIERTGGSLQVASLPTIQGDSTQIQLLFQNLIHNALKYHRPGVPPEVKIYATENQNNSHRVHQIHIVDNGIGFEEKYTERIFSLFERLHGRSEYEGTGVGLAICRKIVEKHNGSIQAASQPGTGSQFIVTLPG